MDYKEANKKVKEILEAEFGEAKKELKKKLQDKLKVAGGLVTEADDLIQEFKTKLYKHQQQVDDELYDAFCDQIGEWVPDWPNLDLSDFPEHWTTWAESYCY